MSLVRASVLSVAALACVACGSSRSDRIKEAERTARREQTPDKLVERGKMFASVGDYTRASQYLSAALDAGAAPEQVLPALMRVYVVSGRYRLAIQTGEQYLTKKPEDTALRFLVGTLYAAVGKNDTAKEQLERVLVAQPKHADAHFALGVLLRDGDSDLVGADYHFRQYLKLQPNGPHAEEARGGLLKDVP